MAVKREKYTFRILIKSLKDEYLSLCLASYGFFALSLLAIKKRHNKDKTKIEIPVQIILSHRHSITLYMVLTLTTITGKVKNMNHRETKNDFFISLIESITIVFRCFI